MWVDEDADERDPHRPRAHEVLRHAKEVTANRTVPVWINNHTVVWITPEHAADPKYMTRFRKNWETR